MWTRFSAVERCRWIIAIWLACACGRPPQRTVVKKAPAPRQPQPTERKAAPLPELAKPQPGDSSPPPEQRKTSSNGLPRTVIVNVIENEFSKFVGCYEKALRKNHSLAGEVEVRFLIDTDGTVATADRGVGTTLPDATVIRCVLAHFRKLRFPKPDGGVVPVTYPVVFSSE